MSAAATPRPVPRHIAIIMDGNGRWAKARGLPRIAGHRRGAEAARRTVIAAAELGVPYLTLFGFSSENWKRPSAEIQDLMGLLRHYLRGEIAELHRNGVCLKVIGDLGKLDPDIISLIEHAEAMTRDNSRIILTIALSYGARAELVAAVREDARSGRRDLVRLALAAAADWPGRCGNGMGMGAAVPRWSIWPDRNRAGRGRSGGGRGRRARLSWAGARHRPSGGGFGVVGGAPHAGCRAPMDGFRRALGGAALRLSPMAGARWSDWPGDFAMAAGRRLGDR